MQPADGDENEDGGALFRRMAGPVRPLTARPRVEHAPARPAVRRKRSPGPSATPLPRLTPAMPGVPLHMESVAPTFHRGGLQHSLLKRLRRGGLRPQARLDLHGQTLAEAGHSLALFLEQCAAQGLRDVLVIHGKGSRSPGGRAVLKPQTLAWLRQHPRVLAYEPALPADGGEGAVYVLLKRG